MCLIVILCIAIPAQVLSIPLPDGPFAFDALHPQFAENHWVYLTTIMIAPRIIADNAAPADS